MPRGHCNSFLRRPGAGAVPNELLEEILVTIEVEHTACVVHQLADCDHLAVWDETRKMGLDRVIEGELSLTDQLQHDGRGETLGEAGDAKAIGRAHRHLPSHVGESAREADYLVAVSEQHDHPWGPAATSLSMSRPIFPASVVVGLELAPERAVRAIIRLSAVPAETRLNRDMPHPTNRVPRQIRLLGRQVVREN